MFKILPLFFLSILLALPCQCADVIFSRRVYASHGRTYQEIWTLDMRTKQIAQLTKTERRHNLPVCSPDGNCIWFLSGAFGNLDDTELWWLDRRTHAETLATQFKGSIIGLLGGTETRAFFTAYEENKPGLYRWDGKLTKVSPIENWPDAAALSPDGRTLAVQTGKAESVTMMESNRTEGRKFDHCASPVWSRDARKLACVAGTRVRVLDLTTGVETAHADFLQRPTPPSVADFSPDGARLLVGTIGANHTSSNPQSDYWILELASGKWEFVGPGQTAIFVSGGVLLVTPRDLAPMSKVHEWVSQILFVDPGKHAQTPVVAGTAYNVAPCRCP